VLNQDWGNTMCVAVSCSAWIVVRNMEVVVAYLKPTLARKDETTETEVCTGDLIHEI